MTAAMPSHYIVGASHSPVALPDGVVLSDMSFSKNGDDLLLDGPVAPTVIVREFFRKDTPPTLTTADGDKISGALARILVNLSDHAVAVLMAK